MNDFAPIGLDQILGFEFRELSGDRAVIEWHVSSKHLQPFGIVHGGVYCAVIESAASTAAALWLGDRGNVVGVNNHTDFLKAAREGRMTAVATPIHRGRSQQLWLVEVTDAHQQLVARGQVRLQNLTNPA